jgi:hypothetical protein
MQTSIISKLYIAYRERAPTHIERECERDCLKAGESKHVEDEI